MLLASSKIFHRRSSPTTALPSAIPYPDVGCMISSVGTIRVAASIGVRLPVRWRSDWPLTIASSPYTGVGSLLGCSVHLLWISLVVAHDGLPSAIPCPDVGCMISSVGTIRVAASIGVRLPVRWRPDWPLTSASSPYTRLPPRLLRSSSLDFSGESAAFFAFFYPLPSPFSGQLHQWLQACKMELSWEAEQAATGGIKEQGGKWFLKPSIKMGQMTCICSSSPDEGGHPRASVLCELF
uniref:Uncharacterized protein n=1 Tax=Oryza nivara TaxID=4536 RepID=A0A0E0IGW3_ORYNI